MIPGNAQEIIKALIEAGFSQNVIALGAGVRQPTISRILSGTHKDPKSSVLMGLQRFATANLETESDGEK